MQALIITILHLVGVPQTQHLHSRTFTSTVNFLHLAISSSTLTLKPSKMNAPYTIFGGEIVLEIKSLVDVSAM